MSHSFTLLATLLVGVLVESMPCAQANGLTLDFKALDERQIEGPNGLPRSRWTDSDTGGAVFNLAFNAEGAIRGENRLPGQIELPIPAAASKVKLSLRFLPGTNGVAAMTLTSSDGKIRLRFQDDKGGTVFAWRDRNISEQAQQFRHFPSQASGQARTMALILDFAADQIEFSNGSVTNVLKGNVDGAPGIVVSDYQKLITSVEGDTALQVLEIEEK